MSSNPAAAPSTLRYAGFWMRGVALTVDTLLMSVIVVSLALLVYGLDGLDSMSPLFIAVVNYGLPIGLTFACWTKWSSTPGKMIFGARIVDAKTGLQPTNKQWCLRYFGFALSVLVLGLGLIWAAFDPRKQTWHDKLAGTVVVRDPVKTQ